jgi:hypothetical protein
VILQRTWELLSTVSTWLRPQKTAPKELAASRAFGKSARERTSSANERQGRPSDHARFGIWIQTSAEHLRGQMDATGFSGQERSP